MASARDESDSRLRLTPRLCLAFLIGIVAMMPAPGQEVAGQDSRGVELRLARPASRIVCLSPGALESLWALGAAGSLVSRGKGPALPPELATVPAWPGDAWAEMTKAGADLLVVDRNQAAALAGKLGPGDARLFVWDPQDFGDLARLIMAIGRLVGEEKAGIRTAARLTKSVRDVTLVTDRLHATERPFVLWVPESSPGGGEGLPALAKAMVGIAGGRVLPPGALGQDYVLVKGGSDPDQPLPGSDPRPLAPPKAVLALGPEKAYRAGPGSASILLELARFLHPDLFP